MSESPTPPITPGKIPAEEFLELLGLSSDRLAAAIGLPPHVVDGIVDGTGRIGADTAL